MSVLITMCIPSCHYALANTVIRACDSPSIVQICPRPLSVQSMCTDDTLIGVCIDASVILITQLNVTKPFIWNWPAECCCYHYTLARSPKNLGKFKKLMQLYYVVVLSQFLYSFLIPSTGKISIWFILHYVLWLAISDMESCSKISLIAPWLCLLIQSNWVWPPLSHGTSNLSNKVASSADTKASQHLLNTRLNHVRLLTRLAWPL